MKITFIENLLECLKDNQKANKQLFLNTIEEFSSFAEFGECEIQSNIEKQSDPTISDYFSLFENANGITGYNSSNMMWLELMKQQHYDVSNIEKVNLKPIVFKDVFADMDGWENYKLAVENATESEEVDLTNIGFLDAMFMDSNAKPSNPLSDSFFIFEDKSEDTTFVRFKLGNCIENSFFSHSKKYSFSCQSLGEHYKRFNLVYDYFGQVVQIVVSKNENKSEIDLYVLDKELNFVDGTNFLSATLFDTTDSFVRFAELKNERVEEFNSTVFSLEDNLPVCNSIAYPLVLVDKGFNLFKEPELKGFDFPCRELPSYKEAADLKTEEIVDFVLVRGNSKSDFGRRTNSFAKIIVQPSSFLLFQFSSLEIERILLGKPETISLPNMDNIKAGSFLSSETSLGGNYMKYEINNSLDCYRSGIEPDFGRSIVKDKGFFFVLSSNELVKDYAIYQNNIVEQSQIDNLKMVKSNGISKNELSFYISSFHIFTHLSDIKNTFGMVSIFNKEDADNPYRNVLIQDNLVDKLSLSEQRKDGFLFDKRLMSEDKLRQILVESGATEVAEHPVELASIEKENILLHFEKTSDEVATKFDIVISDFLYYNINNTIENFSNDRLLSSFFNMMEERKFKPDNFVMTENNTFVMVFGSDNPMLQEFTDFINSFNKLKITKE